MDDLDPLIIGSHEEALQRAYSTLIGMHLRLMNWYLLQAQRDMDKFAANKQDEVSQ